MRSLINNMDFRSLEVRLFKAKVNPPSTVMTPCQVQVPGTNSGYHYNKLRPRERFQNMVSQSTSVFTKATRLSCIKNEGSKPEREMEGCLSLFVD